MRTKFFLMVLAAIVMGSQVTLFAQEKKETKSERRQFNKEQMLEIQCNQIIKGLALDDATAAKFIPVYKQYMEEMQVTRHMGVCRNVANRTAADKQIPKQIQKMYNMEKHNGDKFRKEMKKRQGMKKQHDGRRHMSQGDVKK